MSHTIQHAAGRAEAIAGRSTPASILVVEDEALVRVMVAEELREQNYTVFEADNADEALAILTSEGPVDVLLTDVRMPGTMDGAALARIALARFPAMKVVVVSGHLARSEVQAKIDGFFPKPYDFSRLVDFLNSLCSGDRGRATLQGH